MYFTSEDEGEALKYFLSFDEDPKPSFVIVSAKESSYISPGPEKFYLIDELHNTKEVFVSKKLAKVAYHKKIISSSSKFIRYNRLLKKYRIDYETNILL